MIRLVEELLRLRESGVKSVVDDRLKEFKRIGRGSDEEVFKELCFCILTANFNAERSIRIQKVIGDGFLTFSKEMLAEKLRELGHRYPTARAEYIFDARKYKGDLRKIVSSLRGEKLREWLVRNVKGLGYKEASHFLRNIGFDDYAIIDFHIVDLLVKHGLVVKPKTMTKKRYLEIERVLREVARSGGFTLAELDLYLWYMETGRVLK